jgi:peptide/nickel transport system ATP-binding protein
MKNHRSKNIPIVKLDSISVDFYKGKGLLSKPKTFSALHKVDFTINQGEIVVVVGESGSGKTTMSNVIAGLIKPTAGTYEFNGHKSNALTKDQALEYRNSIQIIQQDSYAALNPMRTMIKSLGDPMLIKELADKNNFSEKVREVLTTVELTPPDHFINKYPHQLSGGQRQRILIARALAMDPQLILADEPVSMIDVSLRVAILNLLARLNEERGIAILYITHDLATARYVGKNGRIAVMYLGNIVETGNVREVLADPKHPYLQALLSAVPIPDPRLSRSRKRQFIAEEDLSSVSNMPTGCRYHTRCIYCQEICKTEQPKARQFGSSMVSCHLAEELPKFELYERKAGNE